MMMIELPVRACRTMEELIERYKAASAGEATTDGCGRHNRMVSSGSQCPPNLPAGIMSSALPCLPKSFGHVHVCQDPEHETTVLQQEINLLQKGLR
jgi:hypothetical protein